MKATNGHKRPRVESWLTAKFMELDADPTAVRIYLLVDEAGARQLAAGKVPTYVRDQARRALKLCEPL
jgi:hypothetical protein